MKAFRFRLEQVLRWRTNQAEIEKSSFAAAASKLAAIEREIDTCHAELRSAGSAITAGMTGSALESWAAWRDRIRRRIQEREQAAKTAKAELAVRLKAMVEANKQATLLEHLKDAERTRWRKGFDRELEAFAAEAFLGKQRSW